MIHDIVRGFSLFGFGFCIILSIGQLVIVNRSKRNEITALLYFSIAMLNMAGANTNANMVYVFPHLSILDLPFLYFIGPTLFIMTKEVLFAEDKKPYWPHLILPLVVACAGVPYYAMPASEKANLLIAAFVLSERVSYENALYLLGLITILAYIVRIIIYIRPVLRLSLFRIESAVQQVVFVVVISLLAILSAFSAVIFNEYLFFRFSAVLATLSIVVLFIYGHRHPNLFTSFAVIVKQSRYKHSYLNGLDINKLKSKLLVYIKNSHAYLDENLSASDLASTLKISIHQLSELLSEHLGKNFSTFINDYRIEEAKNLLVADLKKTILNIAYESGFNSKASFNRAFKKKLNLTPKQYRNLNKPN